MNKITFAALQTAVSSGFIGEVNKALASAYPDLEPLDVNRLEDATKALGKVFPKADLGGTMAAPFVVVVGDTTSKPNESFGLAFAEALIGEIKAKALDKFLAASDKPSKASKDTGQGAPAADRSMGLSRY